MLQEMIDAALDNDVGSEPLTNLLDVLTKRSQLLHQLERGDA